MAFGEHTNGAPTDLPKYVYHYTDAAGFLGIVQDRSIRMSHVWGTNDATEGLYFRDLLWDVATEMHGEDWAHEKLESVDRLLGESNPMVACFSEADQDVAQWDRYADGGRGFAIGFPPRSLAERRYLFLRTSEGDPATGGWIQEISWVKVDYDAERHRAIARLMVGELDGDDTEADIATTAVANAVINKHPAFKPEREWRLVSFRSLGRSDAGLKWRASSVGVVPSFQSERFQPETALDVLFGENLDAPLLAERLLQERVPGAQLRRADVPLRRR